ncbi:MAG TPA: DsbA family protein [Stellaceae bacterium]|jgi:protein-disulfide isomerase|nr:DsbA family protein [Stellaceae bacterium]
MPFRGILAALALAAVAVAAGPQPARAGDITPAQRNEIDAIIHDYLMKNPQVLIDAIKAAEDKLTKDADIKASQAVSAHRQEVFNDPQTPIAGNPKGDVAIVEFFDYRCPYCKKVEPELEALLKQDPKLRLVLKEFPILGPVSVTASHAALAAQRQGKYDAFHDAMMTARGNITDDTVYQVARSVGLDVDKLKRDMASPEVQDTVKKNMSLADALDVHGTPAFIIGDRVVPGAIDLPELKKYVAEARNSK